MAASASGGRRTRKAAGKAAGRAGGGGALALRDRADAAEGHEDQGVAGAKRRRSLLGRALGFLAVATIWLGVAAAAGAAGFFYDLPDVSNLDKQVRAGAVRHIAADGRSSPVLARCMGSRCGPMRCPATWSMPFSRPRTGVSGIISVSIRSRWPGRLW